MLSLKNIGQRLLDSTTLDEKVGNFFRPKTGTLASTGRKWAQELAAKPAPSWVPQQVQQTAQNISDRGGFNRLKQEFTSNPAQFTPLSMKSAAVDTGRKLGSEDLGYGLRGALSLTPFQSAGKLTPKLSAIQQTTAPTTSRQQAAQSLGQTLYGTALTAPLSAGKTVLKSVGNVARNLAVGGTTGALMQGGSDLLTGNFSKESLKQGALSGLQNSWVLPVTNSLTDAAILKLFPKAGLKITGAGVTDPFKLGKIKEGFGRLLTQSLAQVPAENTAFTFLNQLDDKTKGSFTENWMNNLPGNIVGNILSAGVSGSVNVFSNPQSRKIVTDAMKKTVDEWNTPVTMMGGEKMPMWKYKMMYETKPGFARLDLGVGKDTPKLSVEPTTNNKYYINQYDNAGKAGYIEAKNPHKVDIEPGLDTFVSKSNLKDVTKPWVVTEAKSGMAISSGYKTQAEAIAGAKELLAKQRSSGGVVEDFIKKANDTYGMSPRYAQPKPLSVEPVGGDLLAEAKQIKQDYPDPVENPLYDEMKKAQDVMMKYLDDNVSSKGYKSDAEIPKPILKELNNLKASWNSKAELWNKTYSSDSLSKSGNKIGNPIPEVGGTVNTSGGRPMVKSPTLTSPSVSPTSNSSSNSNPFHNSIIPAKASGGVAQGGLGDIETKLKNTFSSRDVNAQKKSFLTTDGEIVGVGGDKNAHYDFFGKDQASMDKYLEGGGIRINKSDSVKYPAYAIEIHQPPTPSQLKQLLSLPDDVNYNYDFYREGKSSLSSDIVTNDKTSFIKNLEKYYPEIKSPSPGGLSDVKPTIKGVTSKSRTDLPQNTLVNTQVQTAPMLDTTKQTVKLSKDINVKSNASEPIIPKSATPDEVASTIPQRLDNFINKTLGYSTQTPTGGTKQASAWTRGIRGIENKLTTGVETAMGSENNLVRNAATNLQNFFRGAGMSPERANASMDLRGGIANANERAYNVMDSLYKSLNNDKASLERINAVLDPELAKTKVKLADLTDTEKQVYGIIREGLDLVHDTSYANGHISSELYQANKGKYTPRLYEVMELPAEVNKFVTQGSKKINNDLYKQRTETNDWKLENSLNDPVYALGKRLSQVETNSAIKQYTNFLASNQRFISDVERPGFTKLSDSPAYGALSGKYVLNSAAEDLKGFFFANQAVQNLYDVFKAYDRLPIRQLQKKLLTVFNPTTNVGNIVSDQVFGFVTGVDPLTLNKNLIDLKSNPSSFKQLSDYLMSKGITGTDITRSDFVNKLSSIDELAKGKKPGVIKNVTDKITSFYGGTDDAYKVAAFKSLLNKGFSLEEATRKVADGFQNYSNVGKFYDVWAKTPIVGSAFIKFQGDLMRIIKNGAVNNPLGLISFLGTLWGVARLSSKLSGESDSDREVRENRFGAPMIPGLKIPLTWQTPMGEINAARYVSPFFANNEVTNMAKMLPFVPTINTKKDVASNIAINANDPLLSPAINLLVNRDFRGKAIADPNENKYQPSTLTSGEQNLNRLKFAGRAYTPPPINSLIDVKAAAEGKPNMYGAKQSVPQAVARLAGIKVQKYGPEEVQAQKAKDAEFAQYANESIQKQINSVYKQELLGEITPAQKEARIKALEGQKKTVDMPVEKEVKTTDKTTGFADIPAYRYIDDNGAMQTIDITKPLDTPKLTGQTEVDKKLISAYKGKITSRINDIVKLVEAGKIEPTKAEEMIKTLKSTQSKLSGSKKPKKITIKTTKAPRVSFKLAKPTKMSVIKAPTSKRARISFKNYKPAKIKV